MSLVIEEVVKKVEALPKPKIIAISGFGGSGKSTFANKLGMTIGAPVVGVDSFQQDGAFDTTYKLWEIMDFSRLEKEVLRPFLSKENTIRYSHFDVSSKSISKTIEIANGGQLIVEGVGLFRPELLKYFSYKIWIDSPTEEAIARGKKRDGGDTDKLWDGIWRDNDLQYNETFKPREVADVLINNV
jgi:uridine kinase